MSTNNKIMWGVSAASVAYSTARYNVFKGVPWSDWPVYVLNKALALSCLLLLLVWVIRARRDPIPRQSGLLKAAQAFAAAQVGVSLAILGPAYFPAFFAGDKLTWQGSVSLLLGIAAASGLPAALRAHTDARQIVWRVGLAMFVAGLHAACYGYPGWFTPSTWPAYLVPITLISFAAGAIGLGAAALAHQTWPESTGHSTAGPTDPGDTSAARRCQ